MHNRDPVQLYDDLGARGTEMFHLVQQQLWLQRCCIPFFYFCLSLAFIHQVLILHLRRVQLPYLSVASVGGYTAYAGLAALIMRQHHKIDWDAS